MKTWRCPRCWASFSASIRVTRRHAKFLACDRKAPMNPAVHIPRGWHGEMVPIRYEGEVKPPIFTGRNRVKRRKGRRVEARK